jgi:hypothetical protein
MKKLALSCLAFALAWAWGGSTAQAAITLTLKTSAPTVALGGTLTLTATETGATTTGFKWYVNGVLGGSTAEGLLSGTGTLTRTYTAPPTDVPNPNPVTFEIVSLQDNKTSKTTTAKVTDSIAVGLSPSSASVALTKTQLFTATISNSPKNTTLNWYVNGVLNGNTTQGTLTGCTTVAPWKCTYTAPSAYAPDPNPAVIEVASAADPSKYKTANVTVNGVEACTDSGSDSLLKGQYAFSLSGFNETGYLAVIGSIKVDGSGHITAGEADTNGAFGTLTSTINTSASSYSVGSNHLGCATIVTTFGAFRTRLAVGSIASDVATEGRIVEWDDPASSAYIVATGHLLQQTPSSFSGGLSGHYAFAQSGMGSVSSSTMFGAVGVLSADSGSFTAGEMDLNAGGTTLNLPGLTGTYSGADSNGRITAATAWSGVNPGSTVFYLVSSSHFLILSKDNTTNPIAVGEGTLQSGTFSKSSLKAASAFYTTGLSGSGKGDAILGILTPNGAGSLTLEGEEDNGGTMGAWGSLTESCSYSVAANGRVTVSGASCGTPPVFYLTAANTAFVLGGAENPLIGQIEPQTVPSGGFTTSSFSGTFYLGDLEVLSHGVASAEQVGVAVMTVDSSGFSAISDYTSTYGQDPDKTATGPLGTVNSNGTISQGGVITGLIISSTKSVMIDNVSDLYPLLELLKQ